MTDQLQTRTPCPPDGCLKVQLMSQETKKEFEYLRKSFEDSIIQARQCLEDFSSSHKQFAAVHEQLKTTMLELNTTVVRQSDRLREGMNKFNDHDQELKKQDERIDSIHDDVLLLKARKEPMSKPVATSIGLGGGAAGAAVVEGVIKLIEIISKIPTP